jgi:hypothetical protein
MSHIVRTASPCPNCGCSVSLLLDLSRTTGIDYFRCDDCLMIWNRPKSGARPINVIAWPANEKKRPNRDI